MYIKILFEKGGKMVTIKDVAQYLDEKIEKDSNFIVCTFYELRIKKDLSKEDTMQFLEYSKNRLRNNGYKVFYTGQKYEYQNTIKTVEDNQLMVAIKFEW